MGLFDFLRSLFTGSPGTAQRDRLRDGSGPDDQTGPQPPLTPYLVPLRYWVKRYRRHRPLPLESEAEPYAFARFSPVFDGFLDMTGDGDPRRIAQWGLPELLTPQDIAAWLDVPLGQLAWLTHRFLPGARPENEATAHYVYTWIRKRNGSHRLIESPKPTLKRVQHQILDEILSRVPAHDAAHGFVAGRSIRSNAEPHVRKRALLKLDLENFYTTVKFRRVVAIFRALGYCREAAIWLGRLTTSVLPPSLGTPRGDAAAAIAYSGRYLPQGAPTSPALANLSAFSLDVRLSGLAKSFHCDYTRYADDLTFSGHQWFLKNLQTFIPLVQQVIAQEQFRVNRSKRRVIRNNQQQRVTGVVVNQKPNIGRKEFDLLKAILTNCVRTGPDAQNREKHANFQEHLRGRIAHISHLNPQRGEKLLRLYRRITWPM